MNQLGIHALVWVGGWSRRECAAAIAATARAGYDFIEVPMLDPDLLDVRFTRKELERHGLAVTASLGLSPETDISSEDRATVERGEAFLSKALSVSRDIGATHFTGVIYSALKKYMKPATQRGIANAAGVLRRIAEQAAESGITVGLETVNRYESNVVNTAQDTVALLERIGADNMVVHMDSYHMNIEENSMEAAIGQCGDRLGYVHIGECHRGYLGSGSVDLEGLFRGLAQADYAGPIAFESFSSAVVDPKLSNMLGIWRNLWNDGEDLAVHAKAYMEAQLKAAREVYRGAR